MIFKAITLPHSEAKNLIKINKETDKYKEYKRKLAKVSPEDKAIKVEALERQYKKAIDEKLELTAEYEKACDAVIEVEIDMVDYGSNKSYLDTIDGMSLRHIRFMINKKSAPEPKKPVKPKKKAVKGPKKKARKKRRR